MSELTLQRLRAEGQAFMEAISRESYLAFAGLKKTAELQPIYKKYERILGPDALELTLDRRPELLADAELDVEEKEILRELMEKKGAAHGRD